MAWTINEDVWIERNADGYARLIRHLCCIRFPKTR